LAFLCNSGGGVELLVVVQVGPRFAVAAGNCMSWSKWESEPSTKGNPLKPLLRPHLQEQIIPHHHSANKQSSSPLSALDEING